MAKVTVQLIGTLRDTAHRLKESSHYQWGHMGACNCGFLAQQITNLPKGEIHRRAMVSHGDWREQLNDYCPASGLPLDDVISDLISFGFDIDELRHLERLSDPEITNFIGQPLQYNVKSDVINYFEGWADFLEGKLLKNISLDDVLQPVLEEESKAQVKQSSFNRVAHLRYDGGEIERRQPDASSIAPVPNV